MNGLERELTGRATVLRFNVKEQVGKDIALRYGVTVVPTFIVFDGLGREWWRQSGYPNRERILQEMA